MMTLAEIARAVGGRLSGDDRTVTGVSTDTRTLAPGDVFVALKGPRFDGHGFLAEAAKRGALAALTDRPREGDWPACVVVADTRIALMRLAAYWRERIDPLVIAVTGSNGKTTVKDMTAGILACTGPGIATEGNRNNDIGLPLTLLRLRAHHRYAVVEIGMNHPGEIATLAALARPDVAIVTNAGAAHLEGLGSVRAVAEEKGRIYGALTEQGVAVVNADDDFAAYWRAHAPGRVVSYGLTHPADVTATVRLTPEGSDCAFHLPGTPQPLDVRLAFLGRHNVLNALAAASAALACDIPAPTIAEGLAAVRPPPGRMAATVGADGIRIIDDTYNANPDSARAALAVLASLPGERWFVLGDMAELGANAAELHGELGVQARDAGIDHLWTVGALAAHASRSYGKRGRHYDDLEALLRDLRPSLRPGAVVLVKGSRCMRMEQVVAGLTECGGRHAPTVA